ncbi:myoneurin-like [Ostrinia nubilalis]|uniref:myoneurin-like n=1 Tax=Ostrinia nubilalis TaxID=29057 RepID=UPI0030825E53
MTSSILAQKLISTKIGKCEFERVKWMRYCNASKQNKVAQKLKKILEEQISNKTCRLCLSPGGEDIFQSKEFDLANNIRSILGVQVFEGDGKPQHICYTCKDTVQKAAELKQSTDVIQWQLQQELDMINECTAEWEPEQTKIHGGYFVETKTKLLREWICSKCNRVFQKRELFEEHDKLEYCRRVKCYVCETCGMELKTQTRLRRHWLTHSAELAFSCTRCPFRSRTKFELNQHLRHGHTAARPKTCPYCPAAFRSASNLASHKKMHFPPAFHCRVCQRGFKFKQALQNHVATQHSNAKPFSCATCGETFSIRKMMRRHELKVHNRPKMRSGTIPGYKQQLDGSQT